MLLVEQLSDDFVVGAAVDPVPLAVTGVVGLEHSVYFLTDAYLSVALEQDRRYCCGVLSVFMVLLFDDLAASQIRFRTLIFAKSTVSLLHRCPGRLYIPLFVVVRTLYRLLHPIIRAESRCGLPPHDQRGSGSKLFHFNFIFEED